MYRALPDLRHQFRLNRFLSSCWHSGQRNLAYLLQKAAPQSLHVRSFSFDLERDVIIYSPRVVSGIIRQRTSPALGVSEHHLPGSDF